jgi:DNA replication protein DnaC
MKKGIYQQLNLAHLEAGLPQLLDRARTEQWTYETFLDRALTSELDGREQQAMARRLKSARIPAKKTLDGFDFNPRSLSADYASWPISRLCEPAPTSSFWVLLEQGKHI